MSIAKTQISRLQSASRAQLRVPSRDAENGHLGSRVIAAIMAIAYSRSKAFLVAILGAYICTNVAIAGSAVSQEVAGNIAKKMMRADAVLTRSLHREFWTALGEFSEVDKDNFVAFMRLATISADEVQIELLASALASYRSGEAVETVKLQSLRIERDRQLVAMISARFPLADRGPSIESFHRQQKIAQASNRSFLEAAARHEVFHSPGKPGLEMTEENLALMSESVKPRLVRLTQLFDPNWAGGGTSVSAGRLGDALGEIPGGSTVSPTKSRPAIQSDAPSRKDIPASAYKPNPFDLPLDKATTTRALIDRYENARSPQEAKQILEAHNAEIARLEVIMSRGPVIGYLLLYGPKI